MVNGNVAFRDYQAKRPELNWCNSFWKMVFIVRKVNCFVNSTYKMLVKLFTCSQFKADGVPPPPPPPYFYSFPGWTENVGNECCAAGTNDTNDGSEN